MLLGGVMCVLAGVYFGVVQRRWRDEVRATVRAKRAPPVPSSLPEPLAPPLATEVPHPVEDAGLAPAAPPAQNVHSRTI